MDETPGVSDREKKKIVRSVSSSQLGREVPLMKEISRDQFRVQAEKLKVVLKWVDYVCDWTGTDESVFNLGFMNDLFDLLEMEGYQTFMDQLDVLSRIVIGSPDPPLSDAQSVTEDMFPNIYKEREQARREKRETAESEERDQDDRTSRDESDRIRAEEDKILDGMEKKMRSQKDGILSMTYQSQLTGKVYSREISADRFHDPRVYQDYQRFQVEKFRQRKGLTNQVFQSFKDHFNLPDVEIPEPPGMDDQGEGSGEGETITEGIKRLIRDRGGVEIGIPVLEDEDPPVLDDLPPDPAEKIMEISAEIGIPVHVVQDPPVLDDLPVLQEKDPLVLERPKTRRNAIGPAVPLVKVKRKSPILKKKGLKK